MGRTLGATGQQRSFHESRYSNAHAASCPGYEAGRSRVPLAATRAASCCVSDAMPGSAAAGGAGDIQVPAEAFAEGLRSGEAKAGTLATRLGGEEGLHRPGKHVRSH